MKSVTYGKGVRENPEYLTLAEEATARLDKIMGRSAPNVSAEWERVEDGPAGNLIALRIWDAQDEARMLFVPDQMNDRKYPRYLQFQLGGLWDDILKARNHRQLDKLLGTDSRTED